MPPRRELRRRGGTRLPRRTLLIVCEGEQTEFLYFQALKHDFHLANVQIDIVPSSRDSHSIVREAMSRHGANQFDEVWCVFDHEFVPHNARFAPAVAEARRHGFRLGVSNPAFEFWLLLHYRRTTQAFTDNDELIRILKRDYPEYEKNRECYDDLRDRQEQAIENAGWVLREQERVSPGDAFPHPSTHVHLLVQHLAAQRDFKG
jgi:hypothetical protein